MFKIIFPVSDQKVKRGEKVDILVEPQKDVVLQSIHIIISQKDQLLLSKVIDKAPWQDTFEVPKKIKGEVIIGVIAKDWQNQIDSQKIAINVK